MDIWIKLAKEKFYKASISKIRLKLSELQELDEKVQKIRAKSINGYKKVDRMLYY